MDGWFPCRHLVTSLVGTAIPQLRPLISCGQATGRAPGFTLRGSFYTLSVMVEVICETCGDLRRHVSWRQLDFFGTHEVRYTAVECTCGYRLLAVTIREYEVA